MTSKAQSQLGHVNPYETFQVAYAALSSIQTERPGVQLGAVGVLFLALLQELNLDLNEFLNQVTRITSDADTFYHPQVRALKEYIKGELK